MNPIEYVTKRVVTGGLLILIAMCFYLDYIIMAILGIVGAWFILTHPDAAIRYGSIIVGLLAAVGAGLFVIGEVLSRVFGLPDDGDSE